TTPATCSAPASPRPCTGTIHRLPRTRNPDWPLRGRFMSKPLNIGMIGYGFMGRAHSNAYRQVSQFFKREYRPVLKACCARKEDQIKAFAENWGYESYETDWRKLIERKDIDAIDVGS